MRLLRNQNITLPFSIPIISTHTRAVLEALLVTLLWSSSYVLIKIGLEEIPALTFAGLRYFIAAIVLALFFLHNSGWTVMRNLSLRDFGLFVVLGLFMYAITQGAQFVALQYLKAATVSLLLTFTPVIVALLSVPLLDEHTTRRQWVWMGVLFVGVAVYFYPYAFGALVLFGLGIMVIGLFSNSLAAILGRGANRRQSLSALTVTAISMAIGSTVLLGTGVTVQGLPALSWQAWGIVLWLALINTAFAFWLWNRTLQTLTASESSVINNTMLAQVAILGWIFLGETLAIRDVTGLGLVMAGALLFQLKQ